MKPNRPNRALMRLRPSGSLSPTPLHSHHRRIAPALVFALAAHVVLVAGLLAWQLPKRLSRTYELPVAPRINFVGMAEPEGGGNPDAGGRTTGMPALAKRKSLGALPAMPPFETQPVQPLRPVIPLDVIVVVSAVPSPSTNFAAADTPTGNGRGNGTGNGVGNGSDTGIAGNGGNGQAGYGSGTGRPDYRRSPRPQYPSLARQNGWEGTTMLRVEVLADGVTGAVEVVESSGFRVLDDAAVEAVREARFEPARLEGVAVVCWVEVPITFRLNRAS